MNTKEENWDITVEPKARLFHLDLKELWRYRDLLVLFVKRDIVATYKQTLLGPLWVFIEPIFTMFIYYFMFGVIANISTGGKPALLFYGAGLVCWNFFTECVNGTSNAFIGNAYLFGKVYFPRLLVPFASIVSASVKFLIQFALFLAIWCYYALVKQAPGIHITWQVVLLPLLVLNIALLGLSVGILVSATTTKYRDLRKFVNYALQFGRYATPIIFALEWMRDTLPFFYKICLINPMTGPVQAFKHAFFGNEYVTPAMMLYSGSVTLVLALIAVVAFNKVEKTFVDTV